MTEKFIFQFLHRLLQAMEQPQLGSLGCCIIYGNTN